MMGEILKMVCVWYSWLYIGSNDIHENIQDFVATQNKFYAYQKGTKIEWDATV